MKPPLPRPLIDGAPPPPVPNCRREGKLCLDMNENHWGPSPKVLEALRSVAEADVVSSYGFPEQLTEILADVLRVDKGAILTTAGGDEAISLVFEAYRDPEDVLLLPDPTFVTFLVEAATTGHALRKVRYSRDRTFPIQAYRRAISSRPRIAVIVNPNNPTGTGVPIPWIDELCRSAPDTLVLCDEAYFEYHGETSLSIEPRPANLVVLRTFSKAYGLAGLRIGYVVAHPRVIDGLAKVRPPFSVSAVALAAAEAALRDHAFLRAHVRELRREMQTLVGALTDMDMEAHATDANFVLVRLGERAAQVVSDLAERGILVSDRSEDPGLEGMVRIVVGRPEQNARLVTALGELWRR